MMQLTYVFVKNFKSPACFLCWKDVPKKKKKPLNIFLQIFDILTYYQQPFIGIPSPFIAECNGRGVLERAAARLGGEFIKAGVWGSAAYLPRSGLSGELSKMSLILFVRSNHTPSTCPCRAAGLMGNGDTLGTAPRHCFGGHAARLHVVGCFLGLGLM